MIFLALKRTFFFVVLSSDLGTLSSNTTSQLNILWHDGDALGVDGAQVGIFEKTYQVSLASLLQSHDGGALETKIGLEILGDFTNETLEGQFADEEFGAFLVTPDFSKSHSSGPVTMGFLHSSGGGGALTGSLGCQLFTRCFASS
jgi:hypothetical protein